MKDILPKQDASIAIDYLNQAAQIFEDAGMTDQADLILNVLIKIINLDWKDHMHGGLADKKSPKDFDPEELARGMEVEQEHTDQMHIAMEIAMDHLSEDPEYYLKLEKMEGK